MLDKAIKIINLYGSINFIFSCQCSSHILKCKAIRFGGGDILSIHQYSICSLIKIQKLVCSHISKGASVYKSLENVSSRVLLFHTHIYKVNKYNKWKCL